MQISFTRLDKELPAPRRAYDDDAGVDLHARETINLGPGERAAMPTGIAVAIPSGYAGLVVPRSGLALREGIGLVNSPGLVDPGYRGELIAVLVNHGSETVKVGRGDRIAQLVIVEVGHPEFVEEDELPSSTRGTGGFGSTGR